MNDDSHLHASLQLDERSRKPESIQFFLLKHNIFSIIIHVNLNWLIHSKRKKPVAKIFTQNKSSGFYFLLYRK